MNKLLSNPDIYNVWPRIRENCSKCGKVISLKWGTKVRPYWAHLPGTTGNCKGSGGEGYLHKLAKKVLVDVLKLKISIHINYDCGICSRNFKSTIVINVTDKVKTEYRLLDNGIADIAIVNNNKVKCIIEIYNTHKTRSRQETWYELNAGTVIQIIGKRSLSDIKELTFNCIRDRMYKCSNSCETMIELASSLGFFSLIEHPYMREIRVAMNNAQRPIGSYYITTSWMDDLEDSNYEETWIKSLNWDNLYIGFLNRQKCLICERDYNTTQDNSYCSSCYKSLRRNENSIYDIGTPILVNAYTRRKVSADMKSKLQKKYYWIKYIPYWNNTFINTQCYLCGEDLLDKLTGYIKDSKIWWYGHNRKLCLACIINRIESKNDKDIATTSTNSFI